MEYKIRNGELRTVYCAVKGAQFAPYHITDGTYQSSTDPIEKLHYHDVPELGICINGSGEYHVGNRIYKFKKGDIQIIPALLPHFSNSNAEDKANWIIITFDIMKVMQLIGILDTDKTMMIKKLKIPLSGIFSPDEHPKFTKLIKDIILASKTNDEFTDFSISFSIVNFLLESERYARENSISKNEETGLMKDYSRIAPAIDEIYINLSQSDTISEINLAKKCNMSISNFRRIFQFYTGVSPKSYIINSRMSYAQYLLINTDMTILKISESVGYGTVSGFNKIFSQTFKMSPSAYRKKYK